MTAAFLTVLLTVGAQAQPSLTITSPDTLNNWTKGSYRSIEWTSQGAVSDAIGFDLYTLSGELEDSFSTQVFH